MSLRSPAGAAIGGRCHPLDGHRRPGRLHAPISACRQPLRLEQAEQKLAASSHPVRRLQSIHESDVKFTRLKAAAAAAAAAAFVLCVCAFIRCWQLDTGLLTNSTAVHASVRHQMWSLGLFLNICGSAARRGEGADLDDPGKVPEVEGVMGLAGGRLQLSHGLAVHVQCCSDDAGA